jgi:hypothetical protein
MNICAAVTCACSIGKLLDARESNEIAQVRSMKQPIDVHLPDPVIVRASQVQLSPITASSFRTRGSPENASASR